MSSVNGGFPASALKSPSQIAPASGATVVVPDGAANVLMWITSGLLATLTVTLPTDGGSFIGQEVQIGTAGGVTILTLNGPGATILNGITALAAGALNTFEKVAANTWARKL